MWFVIFTNDSRDGGDEAQLTEEEAVQRQWRPEQPHAGNESRYEGGQHPHTTTSRWAPLKTRSKRKMHPPPGFSSLGTVFHRFYLIWKSGCVDFPYKWGPLMTSSVVSVDLYNSECKQNLMPTAKLIRVQCCADQEDSEKKRHWRQLFQIKEASVCERL